MGIVDVGHLLFVGAGDYGYLCTVPTKIGYESFYSGDVFVGHLFLVNIEFSAYFELCFGFVREMLFIDL